MISFSPPQPEHVQGRGCRIVLRNHQWARVVCVIVLASFIFGTFGSVARVAAQDDAVSAAPPAPSPDRIERVLAAGDADNLWFLRPRQQEDSTWFRIAHHHPAMGAGVARDVLVVQSRPIALQAVENSLYCIFAPLAPGSGAIRTRQVTMARAIDPDSAQGFTYESLNQSGRILQPLPGDGSLLGVADDGNAPYVLLRLPGRTSHAARSADAGNQPSGDSKETGSSDRPDKGHSGIQDESAGPEAEQKASRDTEASLWFEGLTGLTLRRYRIGEWEQVKLPESVDSSDDCVLVAGFRPVLLVRDPSAANGDATLAFFLDVNDQWNGPSRIDLDISRVETTCEFLDQTILALSTEDHSTVELVMLRPSGVYPIGRYDGLTRARRVVGAPEALSIMDVADEKSNLSLKAIDLATGNVLSTTLMNQQLQLRQEDLSLLIIVGALLLTFIVMFIARPDPTKIKVILPPTVVIAEPRRRLFAALIDLAISAFVVIIFFHGTLLQVLNWPPIARSLDDSMLSMATIGITVLHETISELIWGRTIGKSLSGCQVMSITGARPRVGQILLRNAMKLVALFVPPLALFVFMNPYRQRLGDVVARTVVVVDRERSSDESSSPGD